MDRLVSRMWWVTCDAPRLAGMYRLMRSGRGRSGEARAKASQKYSLSPYLHTHNARQAGRQAGEVSSASQPQGGQSF